MTDETTHDHKRTGFALWFTGLPAAGKSTLAEAVATQLRAAGAQVEILDSDALRTVLTPNPTYGDDERDWFYGVMVHIGHLLTKHGVNVLFAATATRRVYRDKARATIPRFAEIYVTCSLEQAMARDPKQIYARATAGEISHVPGMDVPYEEPLAPAVTVNTEHASTTEGVAAVMAFLQGW
ncbi:MAG: adenylyl-sulfate kinase [Caldilineaceae bacterium]|nr:adenylyl-sulfate kinase [Caldilineaceae bacterium]